MRNTELDEIRGNKRLFMSPRAGNTSVGAVPVGARASNPFVGVDNETQEEWGKFLWGRKGVPTEIAKARE